jgi:hypothetical protein
MLEGMWGGTLGWEKWRRTDPENINDTRWTEDVYEPAGRISAIRDMLEGHDDEKKNAENSQPALAAWNKEKAGGVHTDPHGINPWWWPKKGRGGVAGMSDDQRKLWDRLNEYEKDEIRELLAKQK